MEPEAPSQLYLLGFGLGTMLVLLVLLRAGKRLLSPGRAVARDLTEGNAARRILLVGEVMGVFLVVASVVKSCALGVSFTKDLLLVSVYGAVALALVMVTGEIGVRLLLRSRLPAEVERGNVAAGLAAGSHYVATGIITSRAISGESFRDLAVALGFFALSQVTLHIFILLFRALTTYDDAEQIQGENLAAALSYAGVSIAVAIIIARAVEGDFVSLKVSLKDYAEVLAFVLVLYPVRQILVQVVLLGAPFTLRGGRLDAGVATERSEALGALEAVTYLATALAIARIA